MALMQYISLYFMFICHDAAIYRENTFFYRNIIIIFSLLMLIYIGKIDRWLIYLVGSVIVYLLIRDEFQLLLNYIECILITYVSYNLNKELFFVRYIRLCVFFAVCSLFFYFLGIFSPHILLSIFNKNNNVLWATEWGMPYYMRGRFLYVVRMYELDRNNSIFTEPGIWQMILNTALFILLFMREKLKKIKDKVVVLYIILLSITLFTCATTTGYIAFILIFLAYIINYGKIKLQNNGKSNVRKGIVVFFVVALLYMLFDYVFKGNKSIIYDIVINKIFESTTDGTSGHARYSMIIMCMKFAQNHFFGVGENYLSSYINEIDSGANGAILIHTFASIGMIPVLILLSFFYGKLFSKKVPFVMRWLIIILFLNTTFAQSRLLYPTLIILPIIYSEYCKSMFNKKLSLGVKV